MHPASHVHTHAWLALSMAAPASIPRVVAPTSSLSPVTAPAASPVAGQRVKGIYWSIWLNGYDLTQRHHTTICFCRNIVTTVNLDCWLDLKTLLCMLVTPNTIPRCVHLIAKHSLLLTPHIVFRCCYHAHSGSEDPSLIFASGKMVITGAKSEDDSRLASWKYVHIIQQLSVWCQILQVQDPEHRW